MHSKQPCRTRGFQSFLRPVGPPVRPGADDVHAPGTVPSRSSATMDLPELPFLACQEGLTEWDGKGIRPEGRPQIHSHFNYKGQGLIRIRAGNSLPHPLKHPTADHCFVPGGPTAFLEVFTGRTIWHLEFAFKNVVRARAGLPNALAPSGLHDYQLSGIREKPRCLLSHMGCWTAPRGRGLEGHTHAHHRPASGLRGLGSALLS